MGTFLLSALNYAIYPVIAFALSLLFTAISIRILPKLGFVDVPGGRHVHTRIVPRGGGIAIALSVFVTVLAYAAASRDLFGITLLKSSVLPVSLILLTGLIDDRAGLKSWVKLIAQIIAAVLVWYGVDRELTVFGWVLPWYLSLGITVLWIVGVINAFNMVDGLDGLATGLAAISGICLSVWFVVRHNPMALFMFIFVGACLGFLRYNFAPAKIFLGDTGSMFLGLFLAVSGAGTLDFTVTATTLLLPPLMIGVPIFDMVLAVWRRSIRKKIDPGAAGLMDADSDHLHHRLLRRTHSHSQAAMVMYVLSSVFAMLAIILLFMRDRGSALAFVLLTLTVLVMLRNFAVVELYDSVSFLRKSIFYLRKSLLCSAILPFLDLLMVSFSAALFCFVVFHRLFLNFILFAVLPVMLLLAASLSYRVYWVRASILERARLFFIAVIGCSVSVAMIYGACLSKGRCLDMSQFVTGAVLFVLMTALMLSFGRFSLHYVECFWLNYFMSKYSRKKVKRILMVGRGMSLRIAGLYFCNSQRNNRCYQLVGAVSSEAGMRREFDIPMLGSIDRMEEVFQENPFERVLIVDKRLTAAEREKVVGFCQKNGLECADFMLSAPGISGDANVHGVICPKYLLEFCDMLFLLALSVVCSYFMFGGLDLWGVAIMVAVPITSLICSKLYRVNWGSVGIGDRWRLLQSSSFGAFAAQILCGLMVVVLRNCDLTLEYAVGALIYILAFCGGLQMFRLLLHPSVFFKLFSRKKAGERILIMGGGLHCRLYLLRLMVDPGEYRPVPVGIIDDDLLLHGMSCHGLRVLGGTKDLADIRQRFRFDRIVVTPASVPGATLEELYRFCAENNIKCSSFSVCERPAGMKN